MAKAIIMPKPGITVESCIMTKWLKKKGDTVALGDVLFSYETDKAAFEEEAKEAGTLLEIFFNDGDEVPCLANVCVIGNSGESVAGFAPQSEQAQPEQAPQTAPAAAAVEAAAPVITATADAEGRMKISPRAKALAQSSGADMRFVAATGPDGRIIERDIRALIDAGKTVHACVDASAIPDSVTGTGIGGKIMPHDLACAELSSEITPSCAEDVTVEKLSNMRKVIAKTMGESLNSMAQLTLNSSFDATELQKVRVTIKEKGAALGLGNITVNDMIMYAVARTLKNHKLLNANRIGDEMHFFRHVNLGMAVDTERGLMVPTIFSADTLSLNEISAQSKALASEVRSGAINPDKLTGGTFTVSNLGTLGVESFTPIINPPQTAILGVCCIQQKVKSVNGEMKLYPSMGLSITFDHKALDGADAARFLKELTANLESFTLLMAI
ncbi:MAG: 2-oxo acid dehydrogenase subunit E2 [Clostridiales bacterium]|nr:2-oxo acid dehydrogenase subunit E2 [Clostridiales bacterium]